MQQVASQNAPSPAIVLPHFVAGAMSFLLACGLVCIFPEALSQHFFNPKLLGITHLLVIGWGTMIVFGALYQFIPVILNTKLFSEQLARACFWFLLSGALLLSFSFWQFRLDLLMQSGGSLVVLAALLFGFNIFRTAIRSENKSIARDFILTSVLWLAFTVILGLVLALNLTFGFLSLPHVEWLKIHAHAGIMGWFLQLIIGVGSRLLPMFLISHNLDEKKLQTAWYLINGGLITGLTGVYFQNKWMSAIGVLSAGAGVLRFMSYLLEVFRKRGRRKLDTGMKQSALAFGMLLIAGVLLLVILSNGGGSELVRLPIAVAYGVALVGGFISSLILGQSFKTLPFIVWMKIYRPRVGKEKTPLPRDLYSENMAAAQLWLFTTGIFVLLAGVLLSHLLVIRAGGILLFCAALLYNLNVWKIVFHQPDS